MKEYTDFNPAKEDFFKLKKKIENGNENQCRDSLLKFGKSLAKYHDIELDVIVTEYSSLEGTRGDFMLCGTSKGLVRKDLLEGFSILRKEVILYECKSPKYKPFTQQKSTRAQPSIHLIEAETQLIEYFHNLNFDHSILREKLKASSLIIKMGGMIIGKSYGDERINHTSVRRQEHWYEKLGIKLLNWGEILDIIKEDHGY